MGEEEANIQEFEQSDALGGITISDAMEDISPDPYGSALSTEPTEAGADLSQSPASPQEPDPYQARFDAYEQRIKQLESTLRQQVPATAPRPAWASKPQEQWNLQDWQEYNGYVIEQKLQSVTAESEWAGRLSTEALGQGNDYRSVVGNYTEIVRTHDPSALQFLSQLDPPARYMLALAHEMFRANGNDLVKTVKAIRNGLSARMEGARDVQRSVQQATTRGAMQVMQGGKGRPAARKAMNAQDIWDMSEEEFKQLANRTRA